MFQLNPLILSRGSHFSNSSCLKVKTFAWIAQIAQIAFPIQDEKNFCDHSQQSNCEWDSNLDMLSNLKRSLDIWSIRSQQGRKNPQGSAFFCEIYLQKSVLSFSWHFNGEGRVRGLKVKIKVVPQTEEFGGTMEDQQQHSSQIPTNYQQIMICQQWWKKLTIFSLHKRTRILLLEHKNENLQCK